MMSKFEYKQKQLKGGQPVAEEHMLINAGHPL